MNNIDIFSILPWLIAGFVLLIVLLVILRRIFVNVGAREIANQRRVQIRIRRMRFALLARVANDSHRTFIQI